MNYPISNEYEDNITEIDFGKLFSILWDGKLFIIFFVFLIVVPTVYFTFSMTPIYKATATAMIDSNATNVVQGGAGGNQYQTNYFLTQYEVFQSRKIAEKVIEDLSLGDNENFLENEESSLLDDFGVYLKSYFSGEKSTTNDLENISGWDKRYNDLLEFYMDNLSVSPIKLTQLVNISYENKDPQLAAQIANAHVLAYIEEDLNTRLEDNRLAVNWMTERLVKLKNNLELSEEKLQQYKEREQIIDSGDGLQSLELSIVDSITEKLLLVQQELSKLRVSYEQVLKLEKANTNAKLSIPFIKDDSSISLQVQQKVDYERKRSELSKTYGPKHPKMIAVESEIESINSNLNKQINAAIEAFKNNYELLKEQEKSFNLSLTDSKRSVHNISRKESEFRVLEREVLTNRNLYDLFLNKVTEASGANDLLLARARLIDEALAPDVPVKPKKVLILLGTGLISGILACVIVILRYFTMNRFNTAEDVDKYLSLPLYAAMPAVSKRELKPSMIYSQPDGFFSEAVRTCRTSMSLQMMEKSKTILISSSVPNEGKTTISFNLSCAFSKSGKSTLLVDLDLRKPFVAKGLGLDQKHPGLSDILSGQCSMQETIQPYSKGGYDVITAGGARNLGPQELLNSENLHEFFRQAKEKYEVILLDGPPVLLVSDAMIATKFTDYFVYVVNSKRTPVNVVDKAMALFRRNNIDVSGVILNEVKLKSTIYKQYGSYS